MPQDPADDADIGRAKGKIMPKTLPSHVGPALTV